MLETGDSLVESRLRAIGVLRSAIIGKGLGVLTLFLSQMSERGPSPGVRVIDMEGIGQVPFGRAVVAILFIEAA